MSATRDRKTTRAVVLISLSFLATVFFLKTPAAATAWGLLPPALAIFLAFVSGRLSVSLGSAVLLGSFVSVYGNTQNLLAAGTGAFVKTGQYFYGAASEPGNLQILGFVFFILSMVHIMTVSGGLHALVRSLQRWIIGRRSAEFVTALLGCLIFIDDYANTMIVGSTMKKVTDKYKISREKLAFLVDATSAPIAGVALVSTWIGYEVGLFSDMAEKFSWGVDGYSVFLDALHFRFYCFLMLFFVFVNVLVGVDFGPMKEFEKSPIAESGDDDEEAGGHLLCAIFPLGLLLTLVFTLLWRDGGGFAPEKSVFSLTDWRQVLTQSENGISILFVSSLISYVLAFLLALFLSKKGLGQLAKTFVDGVKSAWLPIMILVLAWSLKEVCDDLKTGEFIVSVLSDRVNAAWMPLSIFVVSAITAFATGTSWGTMAILIPTVTPLAVAVSGGSYGIYVSLCLAAILDGAIMGDHCSPISDTTIMSCISTECDLLNHVKTQLPYSMIVGVVALLFGYLPVGFGLSLSATLPLALIFIVTLFLLVKSWSRRGRLIV